MTLRATCRELVLDALLRRAMSEDGGTFTSGSGGEAPARLQMVVDEATLRTIGSFLRMGDLHAADVTSVELLERQREPLPELDALYLMRPTRENVARLLEDFRTQGQPQHDRIFLALTGALAQEQLDSLASSQGVAPRLRSLVEVPLGFVTVQDRGFHLDMPQTLLRLFPQPEGQGIVTDIVRRLADVCRCLQPTMPSIRHANSPLCAQVARQLCQELARHRRPAPRGTFPVPCQLLIVDRSVDMAAPLVHEYTYEAMAYDMLDGSSLDVDRNVLTLGGGSHSKQMSGGSHAAPARAGSRLSSLMSHAAHQEENHQEALLSDADALWERLKHKHLKDVEEELGRLLDTMKSGAPRAARDIDTKEMLDMLRKAPETKEVCEKLMIHMDVMHDIFEKMQTAKINTGLEHLFTKERDRIGVGAIEQDVACGVDKDGKEVKMSSLPDSLMRVFGELEVSSEAKLRLFMLYLACVANVSESVRGNLKSEARLADEDEQVLQNMVKSRLLEVPESQRHKVKERDCCHRGTKEQIARFKRNAKADGRFMLSRFEPRVKTLLEQLAANTLSEEDFPSAGEEGPEEGLRLTALSAAGPTPLAPDLASSGGDWAFAPVAPAAGVPTAGGAGSTIGSFGGSVASGSTAAGSPPPTTARRLVVFVIGGITYSELRCAAEVAEELPRGTEVLAGGTVLLTPKDRKSVV